MRRSYAIFVTITALLRFSGYFKNDARGRAKPRGPRVSSATKLENWYNNVHAKILKFTHDSQSLNHDISAVLYPTFCKNHHLYLLEISSHWSISSAVVAGLNFNLYKQHVRSFAWLIYAGILQAYTLTTHPKHATSTIKTRYSRDVNKSAGK